jgi:hypothetical protein
VSTLSIADVCSVSDKIQSVPGDLGYKSRGHLCEGLYESKISADFELVSLSKGDLQNINANSVFVISAPPSDKSLFKNGVSITAVSLKPRLYYRMDAVIQQDSTLEWQMNKVVNKVPQLYGHIGIFGWEQGQNERLYIPVIIHDAAQQLDKSSNVNTKITLRAGVNIEYLIYRVFADDYSGEEEDINTFHAAGHPISFEFSAPKTTDSIYKIQVDAKAEGDDNWLTHTLFIASPVN